MRIDDADTRGTTSYTYGTSDFLESVADPRGITLHFEYDNLGRRTRRHATSGSQVQDDQTFAFDLAGNMVSATVAGSGTIGVDYDDDGRMWKTYQQSGTPTTTYSYNSSTGRLASITDPAGTTSFTYTANGQVNQLTEPFSATPVTYTYDTAGRITKRTDGAGLCWTQTYETATGRPDLRTVRVNGSSCNSTVVGTFDLGYDPASNVTSRAETVKTETGANNPDSGTWTYAYDGAGRMTSSTAPSTTATTYAYDGAGNRTSVKVGSGSPVTTTYDGAGLPTSSSDGTTYTHDAIGELTQIDKVGGTANDWNFVYDSWGNIESAAHQSTGTPDVSYSVDALDRVLSRTAGGTATSYTYRGTGEDVAKAEVGASTPVYTAFTPSGPLAQRTGTDAATLRYYVRDWHGDIVGVAATSGTNRMKGSILYSPWGEPGARTGESSTSPAQGYLGFQGDLTDAVTGQVDMLTRYYEPTQGRFTKRDVVFGDPMTPLNLNQFIYGADNPMTFSDPSGMIVAQGTREEDECRGCTAEILKALESRTCTACSPALLEPEPQPFDPGEYQTSIENNLTMIQYGAETFDVPPSVIAAILATEYEYDKQNLGKAFGNWFGSKWCGAPLIGGISLCDELSLGAGQVKIRRAELVDADVRRAMVQYFSECDCVDFDAWIHIDEDDRGSIIGRLRDERWNVLYVAAYANRLRQTAPEGSSWRTIYGTVFDEDIGSYNEDPKFVAGFMVSWSYYSYLDDA